MMRVLFMGILTIMSCYVKAQVSDPGDPGDDPDRVPLDPGTWILVAAGAGYGIKKWKDAGKFNKKNSSITTVDFFPEKKSGESC